jgi:hypothetical protein
VLVTFTLRKEQCPVVHINNTVIPHTITNCEVPWPTFGFQANVGTAFSQKKKRDRPNSKRHWVVGRKSPATLESKVFLCKTVIKPIWTYGIELWGWATKSHIAEMQRSQSKILRMITNAPWYLTNQTLYDDLNVSFIKDVIQEKSINHHGRLGNHSDPILQTLLEQQQRRRLKKLWPADLIDS